MITISKPDRYSLQLDLTRSTAAELGTALLQARRTGHASCVILIRATAFGRTKPRKDTEGELRLELLGLDARERCRFEPGKIPIVHVALDPESLSFLASRMEQYANGGDLFPAELVEVDLDGADCQIYALTDTVESSV